MKILNLSSSFETWPWARFAREIGFSGVSFDSKYDFALSFAGSDRKIAELLFHALQEQELEVFYDLNEQHRILATDVEEYLRPIYQSEAAFVVCVLGPDYPKRIWTRIESYAFKELFATGEVIPIWLDSLPEGSFDTSRKVGGIEFQVDQEWEPQIGKIVDLLRRKLADRRVNERDGVAHEHATRQKGKELAL